MDGSDERYGDGHLHVDVAGRSAEITSTATAGEAKSGSVLDASRHLDGNRPLGIDTTGAGAFNTRNLDKASRTRTLRALGHRGDPPEE